jgi:hypothetical protein
MLHQIICQDHLTSRQLVPILLTKAVGTSSRGETTIFSRSTEVVHKADLVWRVGEQKRLPVLGKVAEEYADAVGVAFECEAVEKKSVQSETRINWEREYRSKSTLTM